MALVYYSFYGPALHCASSKTTSSSVAVLKLRDLGAVGYLQEDAIAINRSAVVSR